MAEGDKRPVAIEVPRDDPDKQKEDNKTFAEKDLARDNAADAFKAKQPDNVVDDPEIVCCLFDCSAVKLLISILMTAVGGRSQAQRHTGTACNACNGESRRQRR